MARVKRGAKRRARRKKYLRRTKGFYLTKSKLFQSAQEAVNRTERYSSPALDSADRRRRAQRGDDLQPVYARAEGRRRGD